MASSLARHWAHTWAGYDKSHTHESSEQDDTEERNTTQPPPGPVQFVDGSAKDAKEEANGTLPVTEEEEAPLEVAKFAEDGSNDVTLVAA